MMRPDAVTALLDSYRPERDPHVRSVIAAAVDIASRYNQLASSFLGMVHLATARYWLKFVHAA